MDFFNIPTDNFYKFLSILGLGIIIWIGTATLHAWNSLENELEIIFVDVSAISAKNKLLNTIGNEIGEVKVRVNIAINEKKQMDDKEMDEIVSGVNYYSRMLNEINTLDFYLEHEKLSAKIESFKYKTIRYGYIGLLFVIIFFIGVMLLTIGFRGWSRAVETN